ncbi:hypothetical protein V7S43_009764 [Phytophthora oleae]|uniref:Tyr recombinase domain-containing protein n=1 Tax=Phytophthora oleae TaxID=2107226 RepID=A0ABD3FDX5_9STRA
MKPVHRRSSTLEFAKKAISSFMPRINTTWDPVTERGNPTRSDAVNKLIKKVKKFEVRREGAESKARRAVEFAEFLNLLLLVRAQWKSDDSSYLVSSVLTLQWHICARIDDMMKLQFSNFSPNTQYPSTLLLQMRWSKNIHEERDAPEQVIIGSMDPKMCVLLNLAIHIESTLSVMSSEFVYGNPKDGDRVVRRFLANTVKNNAFKKLNTGKLGTHSLRKGAATYATRSGVSKDFVNRRGRWRTRKGVVDVYIDNTQPYPDALTAATLKHQQAHLMGETIAATLALPLLWAAMDPSENYEYSLLPNKLQQSILRAFANVAGTPALNPVVREEIFVTGDGSQLNLVIMDSSESSGQANSAAITRSGGKVGGGEGSRREFAALHAQIAAGRRHTTDEVQQLRRDIQRDLQKL